MASIRKRGEAYQVTVSNGRRSDGSQILETGTYTPEPGMTKKQIEKALEQFKVDFEREVKSGQDMRGNRMAFKQLAEQFLEAMKPAGNEAEDLMSVTTWSGYNGSLNNRIIPRLGHLKIKEIIPKILNDYSRELRKDGSRQDKKSGRLSETTIVKDCAIISSVLSYAVGEGLLPLNPIIYSGKQHKRRKATKEYKVKYFTIEQIKAFLQALDTPINIKRKAHDRIDDTGRPYHVQEYVQQWEMPLKWRAYFYLSLFIGDRRGENIALTWNDIDLKTGTVNIDKSTAYADGKIYHKSTKTYKSRTAVIPTVVIGILKQWKSEQQQAYLKMGDAWAGTTSKNFDDNFIFTQESGKQMHLGSPYHEFKRIIRIYNDNVADDDHRLPEDVTPHGLRHTAASILISNNMDPRSVAGILGHADPTTTLNIYSYFFKDKNQEAANIMENVLINSS